ncbi:MAG: class I SAM-dependent methyltransferase [Anaeromyxobacter sp.]
MSFALPAEAYDQVVGRFSRQLAPRFVDFAGVTQGPVLDVGSGPGALTAELAARLGPGAVAAVEPSVSFAEACRARVPGADVRAGTAEALPFADGTFAAALAQLVFAFVGDAPRAARELARVVRPGGAVAACMWEANGLQSARIFWEAAHALDPAAPDEGGLPFRRSGELEALWSAAGLREVEGGAIDVEATIPSFDAFWGFFAQGVGPTGDYLLRQPPARQAELRERCRTLLGDPPGPFTLSGRALAVRGRV